MSYLWPYLDGNSLGPDVIAKVTPSGIKDYNSGAFLLVGK
jgi:hypothetical protein